MVIDLENKTPSLKRKSARKTTSKKSVAKDAVVLVKKHATTDNSYVGISRSVAVASITITALVVSISPSSVWVLGPVIGAMAIFGIALGYFASK